MSSYLSELVTFIQNVYLPDVELIAQAYGDYASIGAGTRNLLAFGVFDLDAAGTSKLLRRGRIASGSATVQSVDTGAISEQVTYSWSHPLSEIVSSLISAGLIVEWLHESPLGFFRGHPLMERREDGHWQFPKGVSDIPLTFSLRATL
jgi:hypothetical protein